MVDYMVENDRICVTKETIRKYYKYIWEDWIQPVPSSNGTWGENSFACNQSSVYNDAYAYKAFISGSMWHSADTNLPHYICWYNPNPLKIDNIYLEVGNGGSYPDLPGNYEIRASEDGSNWITIYSNTNTATNPLPLPLNIDLTSIENRTFKYWSYEVKSVLGRNFGNARNIRITAKERVGFIESTPEDYDFYKDVVVYKTQKIGTRRKYYKYGYTAFTQPVLSSNSGNPNFVVSGTNGDSNYLLYDNNEGTGYSRYWGSNRPDFVSYITLSKPTCFTGFTVKQRKDNDDNHSGHYYILSYSHDGVNYTDLINTGLQGANTYTTTFTNTEYCQFYKFYASPKGGYDEDEIDVRDFSFTGTQKHVEEATEDDYDYYIDTYILYGLR